MKKKLTALLLVVVLAFSLCGTALAAEPVTDVSVTAVDTNQIVVNAANSTIPSGDYWGAVWTLDNTGALDELVVLFNMTKGTPVTVSLGTELNTQPLRVALSEQNGSGRYYVDYKAYSVTANSPSNGSVTGAGSYYPGQSVTITASPSSGYEVDTFTVNGSSVSGNTYTFTMPASAVTVSVSFKSTSNGDPWYPPYTPPSGGSTTPTHGTTVAATTNGSVTVDPANAAAGETVTVTPRPNTGYEVDVISVTDALGRAVLVTRNANGTYSFTMPASSVTVRASFKQTAPAPIENPFTDLVEGEYYYDAVLWAVEKGITDGTTPTTFSPYVDCTRAHVVTFLWRAAGCPEPTAMSTPFTDVDLGSYYGKAVLWAVEKGITNGMTPTTFGPDETCTRGQIVTFLWRAAGRPEPRTTVNPFTDVDMGNYYGKAVQWAVENGITNGMTPTTFVPDNDCIRAQVVTFLYRFLGD